MATFANPSSSSIVGSSDFELLDSILRKLDHLNIEKQVEELVLVNTSGASCDVYKGYWQIGVRRVQLAVKKLRIHCKSEPIVTRVRFILWNFYRILINEFILWPVGGYRDY